MSNGANTGIDGGGLFSPAVIQPGLAVFNSDTAGSGAAILPPDSTDLTETRW